MWTVSTGHILPGRASTAPFLSHYLDSLCVQCSNIATSMYTTQWLLLCLDMASLVVRYSASFLTLSFSSPLLCYDTDISHQQCKQCYLPVSFLLGPGHTSQAHLGTLSQYHTVTLAHLGTLLLPAISVSLAQHSLPLSTIPSIH